MDFKTWTDRELLAMLIGQKAATELMKFGLAGLVENPKRGSQTHPLIAVARELTLRAFKQELRTGSAISNAAAVRDYFGLLFAHKDHQAFVALFLDAQHRIIEAEELFRGSLTHTAIYPREAVKAALRWNAAAVIFAHYHPSSAAQPTQVDELVFRSLQEALASVDVTVLDHFFVTANQAISVVEGGLP